MKVAAHSLFQCLASVSWSSWSNGASCNVGLLRRSFLSSKKLPVLLQYGTASLKPPTEISFSLSEKVYRDVQGKRYRGSCTA
ncbi:hypothetical protein MKW98_029498 [Papaver atlanticum]|uniref:Secreted protein n=1 Tax=Papaver atlanticum TaxID=357466 RepID=A0AAD4SJA6_9MAGN|nr:hypothetical protein MKW98_029498 [Papaver atlanticum]